MKNNAIAEKCDISRTPATQQPEYLRLISAPPQPVMPHSYVDRPRLYDILNRWRSLRAVVIHAPAGYGKTTLVARWVALTGNRAAWMVIDKDIDDSAPFAGWIAAALDPLVPGIANAVQAVLEQGRLDPEQALMRLLHAIETYGLHAPCSGDSHVLLVIDDLHLAKQPALSEVLKHMLKRGPANLHLILISRTPTHIPLARLYAAEQIAEIRIEDLRFSSAELRRYLELRGCPNASDAELAEIQRRSEGWIAVVQIATLKQDARNDISRLIEGLTADSRWLADYLSEEILAQQPAAIRCLLMYSSILDSFNAALCEAISGRHDTQHLLNRISEASLLLMSLDNRNEWFRYHHIFRAWLRQRLLADEGAAFVQHLHRRAAAWYITAGEIAAAIQHLCEAGASTEAANLLAEHLPTLIECDPYQAQRLLALLPYEQRATNPRIMLLRCRLEGRLGHLDMLTYVQQAEQAIQATILPTAEEAALRAELRYWRTGAYILRSDLAAASACLQQSLTDPSPLNAFSTGLRDFLAMQIYNHAGRHTEARYHADQALATFTRERYPAATIAIRRELARHAVQLGNRSEANRRIQQILDEQYGSPGILREWLLTCIFAVEHSYWQNDLAQARSYYHQAEVLAQRLRDTELLATLDGLRMLYIADSTAQDTSAYPHNLPVLPGTLQDGVQLQIALLLRAQRFDEAWHLAEKLGITLRSDPTNRACGAFITFLRVFIARGRNLAMLSPLIKRALTQSNRVGHRFGELWLLTLQAWHQLKLNRPRTAVTTLQRAVRLALETGYTRVVLDIPDLLPLLDTTDRTTIQVRADPGDVASEPGRRVLTLQELAVLRLLDRDYQYERIAQELKISINTVQTHVRNMYAKLNVNRRASALTRAQELGLLAPPNEFASQA